MNVAVTRAQREMIVYASFVPEDMGGSNATLGEETRLLQQFLKLAYRGVGASGDVGIAVPRSRHIESVARELESLGFEVQTQLGLSTLRVDIALRRPGAERWEIAIMVDDSCWAERGSAFQRELLPRQVLPDMGWKRVYRIWLPSWKNAKQEILDELGKFLNGDPDQQIEVDDSEPIDVLDEADDPAARQKWAAPRPDRGEGQRLASPPATPANGTTVDDFEVFTPFTGPRGRPEILTAGPTVPAARKEILAMIDAVLAAEAPVQVERMAKTVCRAFGFNRVNPARIRQIIGLVPKGQIQADSIGNFAWRTDAEWETWTRYRTSVGEMSRAADEIPVIEYGNALVDFVDRAYSLDFDEAVKEVAKAFGFQRPSAQIKATIEGALRETAATGAVVLDGRTFHRASSGQ